MVKALSLRDKRVVVTGGAGFIGSHLVDRILHENPKEVTVLSNFFLGKPQNLTEALKDRRVNVVRCDVADWDDLWNVTQWGDIDVVFNCAVIPLPTSLTRPEWTIRKNVDMTLNLCRLIREEGYRSLIQFSSSEAVGSAKLVPMKEDHPLDPETPYAASKAATDTIALSYHHTFGSDISLVRPYNQYGPRQNAGRYAGIIPLMIGRMLKRQEVTILGDGEQTRDYLHVKDTVDGVIAAYSSNESRGTCINLGSGTEISVNELVERLAELTGYPHKLIRYDAPRPGDVRRHCADISKARTILGWEPKIAFAQGLEQTVSWYLEHPEVFQ